MKHKHRVQIARMQERREAAAPRMPWLETGEPAWSRPRSRHRSRRQTRAGELSVSIPETRAGERMSDGSYTILREGKEVVVRWPMSSADALRVCGFSDADGETFREFINGEWRPYLKHLRVPKSGDSQSSHYLVELTHAQQAARRFGLVVPD